MSKAKESKNLIVGLDIGTSKIAAIVAEIKPDATLEVIGMGGHPSRGLKKGVVVKSKPPSTRFNARWKRPS